MTWIVDVIGFPKQVKGYFEKTIEFGAAIEDSYAYVLKYDGIVGSMIVDVASRYAVRNLVINLEKAQIQWRWDESSFNLYEADTNRWIKYNQSESSAASGYNKNIIEDMYIDEIRAFIEGIKNPKLYPNSIDDDIRVLKILDDVEKSDGGF